MSAARLVVGVAVAAGLVGVPPLLPARVEAAGAEVVVSDNRFSPRRIQVAVGDTVRWRWSGANQHSVWGIGPQEFRNVSDGCAGCPMVTGSLEVTFTALGSYFYYCDIHGLSGLENRDDPNAMIGFIEVARPGAPTPSLPAAVPSSSPPPREADTVRLGEEGDDGLGALVPAAGGSAALVGAGVVVLWRRRRGARP